MPDSLVKALAAIILGFIAVIAVVTFFAQSAWEDHRDEFNDWTRACLAEGGIVGVHHQQSDGNLWYECYVDGEQVEIP